jgi:hypothetical protein
VHVSGQKWPGFQGIYQLEYWGNVAVTLLGGGLRFWDLGPKPLHHDENMHASER